MVFDVLLAGTDTAVNHECGEWRPKVVIQPEVSSPTYDYSYHHPGGGYYGGYAGLGTATLPLGGIPTPTTEPGSEGLEPQVDTPQGPFNVDDLPAIESVDESVQGGFDQSVQAQSGWSAPNSPAFSQRHNIFKKEDDKNVVGTWIKTKPQGYTICQVDTWIKVSDFIPVGEEIVMNLKIGVHEDDGGPLAFANQRIVLTSTNITPTKFKRVYQAFKGFTKDRSRAVSFYFERRNDILPQPDVEVFVIRHLTRWFP